ERGGYADISKNCLYYIGGILKHAPALLALIAPSTNSYKRLVPGYEAPINLVYSQRNRSACIRIPMYSKSEGAKRIEFRTPDPTCNPYLSFSACLMAGLAGIPKKINPGKPVDKDLYELPPAEAKKIKQLPGDLSIVLDNLEKSHDWLLKGDVFTPDVIETWIEYKRKNEVDAGGRAPPPLGVRALLRHLIKDRGQSGASSLKLVTGPFAFEVGRTWSFFPPDTRCSSTGYRTAQSSCRGPPVARSRLATTSVSGPLHVRAPRGRQGRSVRCNIQGTKPRSLPAPQQHLAHGHRELIDRKVRVDDTAVDRLVTVEYSCGLRLLGVARLCANRKFYALEQPQNASDVGPRLLVRWNAAVTRDGVNTCVVRGERECEVAVVPVHQVAQVTDAAFDVLAHVEDIADA